MKPLSIAEPDTGPALTDTQRHHLCEAASSFWTLQVAILSESDDAQLLRICDSNVVGFLELAHRAKRTLHPPPAP